MARRGNCRYLAESYSVVYLRIHFKSLLEGKEKMTFAAWRQPGLGTKAEDE